MLTPDEQVLVHRLLDRFFTMLPIRKKRKCAHRGCPTLLSCYNKSIYCHFHQRLQPLRREMFARKKDMADSHKKKIRRSIIIWHRRKKDEKIRQAV